MPARELCLEDANRAWWVHTQVWLALQKVVIMGTGAFALEAMEAADRSNAEHITLVSRPRNKCAYVVLYAGFL